MDSIYKCYDGTYIDLERIVAMKKQGYSIHIFFQLLKEPVSLLKAYETNESFVGKFDGLVNVWKEYKNKQVNG